METDNHILLEIAVAAARRAGKIQKESFTQPKEVFYKGTIDLVTNVDKECEKVILSSLKQATPTFDILSEESPFTSSNSSYLWIVDPLDGTTNYSHGYPCFSVSIALQVSGELSLGVVYNPTTDESYTAIRNQGAFRNGQSLKVSRTKTVEHSLLCTGFPYDVGTSKRNNLREFSTVIQHAQGVRRDGSAALDLCRVAEGSFDGFWELKLKPWDVAAGALIALEAGGTVTTFDGSPFDPFADSIICTNGHIHDALKDLLNERA
ncbi:MAG: inositol monophosphatase [Deltaproteobacteria bacterium]|nr:MAG: inositol monophosphatase [Deltaproteobacteria bacterium]